MNSVGVYLHIPFCKHRCGYCDFNVYVHHRDESKARYVDALCREITAHKDPALTIPTIFFGGGTPTQLPAEDLARILDTVRATFTVAPNAEITTEANPDDATPEYFATLRAAGFNRLSFGVQSFNDTLLKTIDRVHSASQACHAVTLAKDAGFTDISLDLMFALPRQTLSDWERSLDIALSLNVPHFSLYSLIVEEKTIFWAKRERNNLPLPSEDTEADMFALAIQRMKDAGYLHYEVSNFARPGYTCKHNEIYWRNEDYFGFGAGAVGYRNGVRHANERYPNRYSAALETTGTATVWNEQLSREETMGETIMLALRLRQGMNLDNFATRFGVRAEEVYAPIIAKYQANGLLEQNKHFLRLTERGLFVANEVMGAFLP